MSFLPNVSQISAVPPLLWLWAGALLFLAAALGFGAGVWFERGAPRRALNQARKSLNELLALTSRRIESAQETCDLLERTSSTLTERQADALSRAQSRLTDSLGKVCERRASEASRPVTNPPPAPEPFELEWSRESLHRSGFPDRRSFEQSLELMLAAGRRADAASGLLLVKADRRDALQGRFGEAGAERLVQKLGGVLCRSIRDEDLVCRIADDSYAVLFPQIDEAAGKRMAEAARESVRHYHFRIEDGGEEVLVTASFGYTNCGPYDNADLVADRAGDALSKSVKRGRNQLHLHDGRRVVATEAT